jgi:hypothetical protein
MGVLGQGTQLARSLGEVIVDALRNERRFLLGVLDTRATRCSLARFVA